MKMLLERDIKEIMVGSERAGGREKLRSRESEREGELRGRERDKRRSRGRGKER